MVQPRSQRRGRNAEIGPHDVFAEELVELHADRVLQVGDAAHMPWRVPRVCTLVGVLLEFAEVRRQQLLVIALDREVHAVGDERGCIAEEVDVLMHLLDDLQRQFADKRTVRNQKDRDLLIAAANGAEDLERGAFVELVLPFDGPSPAKSTLCEGSEVTSDNPSSGVEVLTTS